MEKRTEAGCRRILTTEIHEAGCMYPNCLSLSISPRTPSKGYQGGDYVCTVLCPIGGHTPNRYERNTLRLQHLLGEFSGASPMCSLQTQPSCLLGRTLVQYQLFLTNVTINQRGTERRIVWKSEGTNIMGFKPFTHLFLPGQTCSQPSYSISP